MDQFKNVYGKIIKLENIDINSLENILNFNFNKLSFITFNKLHESNFLTFVNFPKYNNSYKILIEFNQINYIEETISINNLISIEYDGINIKKTFIFGQYADFSKSNIKKYCFGFNIEKLIEDIKKNYILEIENLKDSIEQINIDIDLKEKQKIDQKIKDLINITLDIQKKYF